MLLTPKQRLVYQLVRRQGATQKDVAARLRLSEPAISRLLSRADDRVRDLMNACGRGTGDQCPALDLVLRN